MTTFDIVIPCHGRPQSLAETLESIAISGLPTSFREVLLVENGGQLGAEAVCSDFSNRLRIRYVYEEVASLTKARNLGIRLSNADVLLFLDSDVKLVDGALESYREAFESSAGMCFFGGPLYPEYETEPPSWLREFLPWSAKGHHLGNENMVIREPLFLGGNFAAHRSALIAAGFFEGPGAEGGSGGGVGEETRLQQRLLGLGVNGLYVAGGGVVHPVPASACSQAYVLHRQRRHAETEGMLAAQTGVYKRLVFGAPDHYWRRYLASLIRLPLFLNPFASQADRFRRRREFARSLAIIVGFRRRYAQEN